MRRRGSYLLGQLQPLHSHALVLDAHRVAQAPAHDGGSHIKLQHSSHHAAVTAPVLGGRACNLVKNWDSPALYWEDGDQRNIICCTLTDHNCNGMICLKAGKQSPIRAVERLISLAQPYNQHACALAVSGHT